MILKTNRYSHLDIMIKRSLNRNVRKQELIKITQENQAILKRLQAKQATYSVEKWEDQFQMAERYRMMHSENPQFN
jgi:hypothetical protein